jgi:hypothetical protein
MNWWPTHRCLAVQADREAKAANAATPAHWTRPDCPECHGTGGDEGIGCHACWQALLDKAWQNNT